MNTIRTIFALSLAGAWCLAQAAAQPPSGSSPSEQPPLEQPPLEQPLSAQALSEQPLSERVAHELTLVAGEALPPYASVTVTQMTPVRGEVKTIEIVRYEPRTGYFEARVGNGRVRKAITGRAQARAEVYAPVRAIPAGDVAHEIDFVPVSTPLAHLPREPLFDIAAVAGKEARRSLAANRPASADWFREPVVVRRNAIVTVSLEDPYITLTARGRALDDGARGDVIRVMHLGTASIVEGVVEGPTSITVQ